MTAPPLDFVPGWQEEIDQAQEDTHVVTETGTYPRIPYGPDHPGMRAPRCRDCGVERGQLHVVSCMVEVCPVCRGQAFGCPCLSGCSVGRLQ